MLNLSSSRSWCRFLQKFLFGLCLVIGTWIIFNTVALFSHSSQPTDAFFVLGGSIDREVYAAMLAQRHPHIPVLISGGSEDPCIWLIFQKEGASQFQNVWLEKCAHSTFDNFYYGIPILHHLGVNKLKLITSGTQVFRAKLMAQILLGTHGIWMEVEVAPENGIPGNTESWLKTSIDVTRSLLWAPFSLVIQPQCSHVTRLIDVDMQQWRQTGFKCEHYNP